jgi:hypothetical protein
MDRGVPIEELLGADARRRAAGAVPVGTPKGWLTRLEHALLEPPWHQARPEVKVKLLPDEGELYLFAERRDRVVKAMRGNSGTRQFGYLTGKCSCDAITRTVRATQNNRLDCQSSCLVPCVRHLGGSPVLEELEMLAEIKQVMRFIAAAALTALATVVAAPTSAQVNTGFINPATWIRGPLYAAPANPPIWAQPKLDHLNGHEWALGTQSTFSLTGYCATATKTSSSGSPPTIVDTPATWTEMQHSSNDWFQVWAMWNQPCAYVPVSAPGYWPNYASALTPGSHVPGSRLSTMLRRDIQKALDGGAMQLVVPTLDSVEEAQDVIDLIYFPPIGHRTYGPSQALTMYANVPGGYRQTFNANVTVWFMIETILGSQAAGNIGALANPIYTFQTPPIQPTLIDGLFGATSDLGNFSGFLTGDADYELLIRNAYNMAHAHGEGACTAFGFRGREANPLFPSPLGSFVYAFDCYQN